jgi:hypothetical protein
MSEEAALGCLILLGSRMRAFLEALAADPTTELHHRKQAREVVGEWDAVSKEISAGTLPSQFRTATTFAKRVELLLLCLNRAGPLRPVQLMEDLQLKKNEVFYTLNHGPFSRVDRWRWQAQRVSGLWTELDAANYGQPKVAGIKLAAS